MRYAILFYALRPHCGETIVSEHRVDASALAAYKDVPEATLRAIRLAEPAIDVDGFRIEDETGFVVLDYVEDGGRA